MDKEGGKEHDMWKEWIKSKHNRAGNPVDPLTPDDSLWYNVHSPRLFYLDDPPFLDEKSRHVIGGRMVVISIPFTFEW